LDMHSQILGKSNRKMFVIQENTVSLHATKNNVSNENTEMWTETETEFHPN